MTSRMFKAAFLVFPLALATAAAQREPERAVLGTELLARRAPLLPDLEAPLAVRVVLPAPPPLRPRGA